MKETDTGEQLSLKIKEPKTNYFSNLKTKIGKSILLIENRPLLKDPVPWFFFTLNTLGIILQFYIIIVSYKLLPTSIPLLSMYTQAQQKIVPTQFILVLPALCILLLGACVYILIKNYTNFKPIVTISLALSTTSSFLIYYSLVVLINIYNV